MDLYEKIHSHSTMYLLKLDTESKMDYVTEFTFHHVSIKTKEPKRIK